MEIREVARELNRLSRDHPIGQLQALRAQIRGKPTRTHAIFTEVTIKDEAGESYAFHDGGRGELQFNIGFESREDRRVLRYGVAFSLETSRSLPDISVLFPKIERFNYYIRTNPAEFPGLRMWRWRERQRYPEFFARPFDRGLVETGNFLFFGDWVYEDELDLEYVLRGLDRLLPLYAFVEGGDYLPTPGDDGDSSTFRPGHSGGRSSTRGSRAASEFDIALRHNELQDVLHRILIRKYGPERVRTEYPVPGGQVDAAVNHPVKQEVDFYEIKVAPSARCALREALGQILDYCYWPDGSRARKLIVVGESEPNEEARKYLDNLRRRFGLRLEYRRLDMETELLGAPA